MVCGACAIAPVMAVSALGASATTQRKVFLISLVILFFSLLIYFYYTSTCEQCSTKDEPEED
jgi:hypothetical protein